MNHCEQTTLKCSVTVATKYVIQELNWKQPQIINNENNNGSNILQLRTSVEAIAPSRLAASMEMSLDLDNYTRGISQLRIYNLCDYKVLLKKKCCSSLFSAAV